MVKLALVRHGTTDWNRRHIIQGNTDIPLDELGREEVDNWSLPQDFEAYKIISSPLCRAITTAFILGGEPPRTDQRLTEMSWGEWEGCVLDDLRQELGDSMIIREARGLDFKGPNGESPREVQNRVRPLLNEIAGRGDDTLAVCHKGIIRAIFAMADNWDMIEKPKHKLKDGCLHLFELDTLGHPKIIQLNVDLTA